MVLIPTINLQGNSSRRHEGFVLSRGVSEFLLAVYVDSLEVSCEFVQVNKTTPM
jgi:hypothetical protein